MELLDDALADDDGVSEAVRETKLEEVCVPEETDDELSLVVGVISGFVAVPTAVGERDGLSERVARSEPVGDEVVVRNKESD